MNKELIEQIRNGKALHYDIDNVELLRDVLQEAYPKDKGADIQGQYKYYFTSNWINDEWSCDNETDRDTIPLSSFLDNPKMISVEAVKDWVEQNTTHKAQDGYVIADNLLTFLNEIK